MIIPLFYCAINLFLLLKGLKVGKDYMHKHIFKYFIIIPCDEEYFLQYMYEQK